eukprot:gene835-1626_t
MLSAKCYMAFILVILSILSGNSYQYKPRSIVLVDPFVEYISGHIKSICKARDLQVIDVVSPYMCGFLASQGRKIPESLQAPGLGEESNWAREFNWTDMCCVLAESEAGLTTAERMQVALNLPGNGESPQLRNKYLMNEACRDAGMATIKECLALNWTTAETFLVDELHLNQSPLSPKQSRRCVLKPVRGVASDGVFLCDTLDDARTAFHLLLGAATYGGGRNTEVLLQEFAVGQEYAVDTVSRDGVVKVLALWKFNKRPANCSPFVYQCTELVRVTGPEEEDVIDYALEALRATGLRWGPAHTEVILTLDGPRLVEVNARWHVGDVVPIMNKAYGYDSLTATVDAFTDEDAFAKTPARPVNLKASGRIVHLISFVAGEIKKVKHMDTIKQMKSCLKVSLHAEVGEGICKTVDMRTDCGYVLLSHPDESVVEEDYRRILQLQPFMYEVVDEDCEGASWASGEDEVVCDVVDLCSNVAKGEGYAKMTLAKDIRSSASASKLQSPKKPTGIAVSLDKAKVYWRVFMRKTIGLARKATMMFGTAMLMASVVAAYLGFNRPMFLVVFALFTSFVFSATCSVVSNLNQIVNDTLVST